jgi:hypothetical protein
MIPVPGNPVHADHPAGPTAPAQLHIGLTVVPLPMPEAGEGGDLRFGDQIYIDHVSEDFLAVLFSTVLVAQHRESDARTARQIPRRRTA